MTRDNMRAAWRAPDTSRTPGTHTTPAQFTSALLTFLTCPYSSTGAMPVTFQGLFSRKKKAKTGSTPAPTQPVPPQNGTTTTHTGNISATASTSLSSIIASPSLNGVGPRIAYLYSVPLIHRLGNVVHEPDVLDTGQELQSLRKTLIESGRRLTFRAEVATVRNFRFLVTLGCRMLHYTGHGNPSCLIFESENGEANPLTTEMLSDLFRAGGVRTELVFVSACHSESAGHSFAAAGVPHVVAVKFDEKGPFNSRRI